MKNRAIKITFSLFALASPGLMSCSKNPQTQDEIVAQNAQAYVQAKMSDPQSYELVGLELIDSVKVIDNIKFRVVSLHKQVEADLSKLDMIKDLKNENPSDQEKDEIRKLKVQIENNERMLTKIDSIQTELGDQVRETASYTYRFTYKANDDFGKQQHYESFLQTGLAPEYKVLVVTGDKRELGQHSNDFPGYQDMIDTTIKE